MLTHARVLSKVYHARSYSWSWKFWNLVDKYSFISDIGHFASLYLAQLAPG